MNLCRTPPRHGGRGGLGYRQSLELTGFFNQRFYFCQRYSDIPILSSLFQVDTVTFPLRCKYRLLLLLYFPTGFV